MSRDLTCIYYTGHREDPAFEAKIQQALLDSLGDLPLISVSQRPIDLGRNICVGNVGTSAFNAWRQLQIGVEAAETPFVCAAESDYLYAPDYFAFRPPRPDTLYIPDPVYVLFAREERRGYFAVKPNGNEGTVVASRDMLLERLKAMLGQMPWRPRTAEQEEAHRDELKLRLADGVLVERFPTRVPTLNFKTDANLHARSTISHRSKSTVLAPFGTAEDVLKEYCA